MIKLLLRGRTFSTTTKTLSTPNLKTENNLKILNSIQNIKDSNLNFFINDYNLQPGWTRYKINSKDLSVNMKLVEAPDDFFLYFRPFYGIGTCNYFGEKSPGPGYCVALGESGLYFWLSKQFCNNFQPNSDKNDIPHLKTNQTKNLIIENFTNLSPESLASFKQSNIEIQTLYDINKKVIISDNEILENDFYKYRLIWDNNPWFNRYDKILAENAEDHIEFTEENYKLHFLNAIMEIVSVQTCGYWMFENYLEGESCDFRWVLEK